MSQLKIYDGSSWINIPASGIGIPSGGTQGQVLTKSSSTDYATEWAAPLQGETGQATVSSFGTITKNILTRIGNICLFEFSGVANATINAWTSFITLPVGFRLTGVEDSEVQFNGVLADANDIMVIVIKNGETVIQSKTAITSGKKLSFTVAYTTSD